jgi:hypothetical protein
LRVWDAFGTVPASGLKKQTARVGDLVAVKYFGAGDGTDHRSYWLIIEPKMTPTTEAVVRRRCVDLAEAIENTTPLQTEAVINDRYVGIAEPPIDDKTPVEGGDGISS